MAALTLPFARKSDDSSAALILLALVACAFVYVAYRLWRHHDSTRAARKAGVNRRHDGRHGNH